MIVQKNASNVFWPCFLASMIVLLTVFSNDDYGFCTRGAAVAIGRDEAFSCLEYWINRYQSLFGGVLALLGAVLAFIAVQKQIDQTERLARVAKTRKENAITAISTIALDAMVDYADLCVDQILNARRNIDAGIFNVMTDVPHLPHEALLSLRDYVEFGSETHAKSVSILLSSAQIQNSRMGSVTTGTDCLDQDYISIKLQDLMFDTLDVRARADALFSHVREDYESRGYDPVSMLNGLLLKGIDIADWPHLRDRIDRSKP